MDGLSSAREALAFLEEHGDSVTITTLKGSGSGGSSSTHSSCEEERAFSAASSSCKESAQQLRYSRHPVNVYFSHLLLRMY